ncbi:MAG: helix-turn-helix domain-containing protein [Sphaerochaeta sp.]|jgi:transcriptional regulator with XRE-family HTH domain|nr:helix-turn-helix domain-containing protein [Sphaerochaeta sp.]
MKIISTTALAQTVADLRRKEGLTQAQLGELTALPCSIIARLEREDFIPSIAQLQALSSILGFDLGEILVEKGEEPSSISLQRERLSEEEQKDFDTLIAMMLTLRQQLTLRRAYEREMERAQ